MTGGATATTHTVTGLTDGTAYTFEVRAVNGAGDGVASNQATATPNTAPTVTTQADPSFAENGTGTVATYTATDAESNNITWSLTGADSALLSISASGEVTFDDSPDYEAPADDGTDNIYNVNVIATDDAPAPLSSADYSVTVTVTNVDEDGVVTLAPATAPKVGVEITATLSDPDGGETNHVWKWESTPDGTVAWADISGATAAAYTPVSNDDDKQLRATVTYTDAEAAGKSAMSDTTGAVTENQPPPTPTLADQTATAGTRFSYQFDVVTDSDGNTVTYSATLGNDSALPSWLRFNNATRTFSGTPQAGNEGAITVKVTVTDDGAPPKSTPGTFTITVGAAAECTALAIDQDDSTTPGDTVDLTLSFAPANCGPGALTSELTITLHEDIGVPDDFDKVDVIIRAGGRFEPDWADYNEAEDGTHEIELPGCQAWGPSSQNALGVCDRSGLPASIVLEDIQLPSRPSENGEGYEITIQWDDSTLFTEIIDVAATLDIAGTGSDRREVAYGETITFTGTGFGNNLTVRLYARSGDSEVACTDAGSSGWDEIGTKNANDRGSFSIPIVVDDSAFDSAGAYQVCAVDGGGTRNEMPVSMSVKFGIQVTGDAGQEFTPGEDVRITLIGGGSISAADIDIYVGGRALADSEWDLRGDDLVVTLPPGESGNVQIAVFVNQGQPGAQRANANITVGSLELEVTGLRPAGLILGQSFLVQVDGLAGTEVRSVRIDDIELAFLQGGDIYRSDEYPQVPSNGRFTGSVIAINRDGTLSDQLIRMALDSDGTEELEIEDSAGVVASTEVNVAVPTITIDPAEGSVSRGGEITITGQNFPIYHDDYNREEIEVFVNDRREARIESSSGSWTQKVTIRRNLNSGDRLDIEVRIGDYSFRNLIRGFDLRVTPAELAVIPKELKIGNPFRYTVTGLEGFVRYAIKIDDRLEVVEFTTDDAGNQTGITVIPVDYHRTFATSSGQPATLQVNDSQGARVAGVFFTVILQPEPYQTPTPVPTNTPLPTNTPVPTDTPVPTNTPLPTDTPIPPTDTPVPPTDTPVPPTEPPTPFPTVTPEQTVDAEEVRQTVVAQLQPTLDPDIRDRPARQSDTGAEQNQSIFGSATLVLSVGLAVVLALIVALVVVVLILRRRAAA